MENVIHLQYPDHYEPGVAPKVVERDETEFVVVFSSGTTRGGYASADEAAADNAGANAVIVRQRIVVEQVGRL